MADDSGILGQTVGSSSGGGLGSSSSLLSLGALGVGAAGFGAILGEGESPLPGEFNQLTCQCAGIAKPGFTAVW